MVDYLWGLMVQGEYKRCLELAEVELLKDYGDLRSLAKVNYIIFFARMKLGEHLSCLASGMLALKLAQDAGDPGLEARVRYNLGHAHRMVRRYAESLDFFHSCLELVYKSGAAPELEGPAWQGIGFTRNAEMKPDEAVTAYEKALDIVMRKGDREHRLTALHDLVSARLGGAAQDPRKFLLGTKKLLDRIRDELRVQPDAEHYKRYLLGLGYYYLYSSRYGRALVVAYKTLDLSRDDQVTQYYCHIIMYRAHLTLHNDKDALGHALAARMAAISARRFDLEYEAAEHMMMLLRAKGQGVIEELDREYRGMGIDLGRYISPDSVRRRLSES